MNIEVELLPRQITLGSDGYDVTTLTVRYNVHLVMSESGSNSVGSGTMNLAMLEDDEFRAAAANFMGHVRRVLRVGAGLEKSDLRLIESPIEAEDEPL